MNELDALAIKAQNGDEIALNELYGKLDLPIRKFVTKLKITVDGLTKDDLYQVAGEYFMKALYTYDASRGAIIHHVFANVKSGLITEMNRANNVRNKSFRTAARLNISLKSNKDSGEVEVQDYIVGEDVLGYRNTADEFHYHEDIKTLREVMDTELTPYQRKVLELWMDGKNYREVGELLGRAEKSIDNATHKAKYKLRKYFQLNSYKELI